MTEAQPGGTPPLPAKTIDELFGGQNGEEADPFAELGAEENHSEVKVGPENGDEKDTQQELGDNVREVDPVPQEHQKEDNHLEADDPREEELAVLHHESEGGTGTIHQDTKPQPSDAESIPISKDFSALLEEFGQPLDGIAAVGDSIVQEDSDLVSAEPDAFDLLAEPETEPATVLQVNETTAVPNSDPINPLAALISDSQGSSPFDDILTQDHPAPPDQPADSPVPNLSIENSRVESHFGGHGDGNAGDVSMQSLFSNASDWLADTTIDESAFDISPNNHQPTSETQAIQPDHDGHDQIPFEVPQGWYDEEQNWHWYTDEEKEQVRLSMLGAGHLPEVAQDAGPDVQGAISYAPQYSPGLGFGQSENAARRTPQPEQSAQMGDASYDPYAPSLRSSQPPSSSTTYGSYSSQSPYASQTSSYGLASASSQSQPSPYAPATAPTSFDPYAPSTSAQPYAAPYSAPSVSAIPPIRAAGPSQPSTSDRPAQPKRVASNAYDPPFLLKAKKSFVRPPSAMSLTPAPFVAPQQSLSPPVASPPPAPPSGPPRRSKTPSAAPHYAEPIRKESATTLNQPGQDILQDPNVSAGGQHIPSHSQYAPAPSASPPVASQASSTMPPPPPPPVRNRSYNAFDPPLRPTSSTRSRPVAAPVHAPERTLTPPISTLSPPPPPQTLAPAGPPRGPSRGAMRKQSPMFEAKPSFEHRSPSRSSALGLTGPSPSAPHHELQRTVSSHQEYLPQQSPYHRPREEDNGGDFDPEGGTEREEPSWAPRREDTHHSPAAHSFENPPHHAHFQPDESSPPRNTGYEPIHPEPSAPHHDPSSRDVNGFSSYGQTPYQPTQNSFSYQSEDRNSGLGLHQIGSSPQAEPKAIPHDPYGPQSSDQRQTSSYDPYGQSNGYQPTHHTRLSDPYEATTSYAPISTSTLLHPIDSYGRPPPTSSYGSDLGTSPPQPSYFQAMTAPSDESYVPQQVLEQRPVSEDPLGRCTLAARNAPLAVFGFGGVLITAFPALADSHSSGGLGHSRTPSYGYASGRGQLWIRTVSDLASSSALKPNDNVFPGPLVLDPSTAKGSAGDKKKRETVIAYLEARAAEIEQGLPYLKSSANQARREEEGKLTLVRLLAAMIVGDGKFSGNDKVEDAVRTALASSSSSSGAINLGPASAISPIKAQGLYSSNLQSATPVKASSSQLADLSNLLISGDKRDAARYAANAGLWSHALVISSSVDQELWSEIVLRFASAELDESPNVAGLKASYAVFSGKTASSVDDLISAANLTGDPSQDQWREVIAAVVFNGKPADLACLDELGARLRKSGLNYPSHVCHLLSPTSPFTDVTPAAFDRIIALTQNVRDEDAIVFAEIAEYGRSLVTLPKGQELPFPGLPQLLPYKLQRAWWAAELGDVDQAKRYCTAVEAASKLGKNGPSLLPPPLLSSLEDLSERLTGTPSANPARLIGGRKSKAGLGSWIEGRLTKFIAGEEDGSTPPKPIPANKEKEVAGPFSHFSTISPAASGQISRTPSMVDVKASSLSTLSDSRRTSPLMHQGSSWGQAAGGEYDQQSPTSSTFGADRDHGYGHPAGSAFKTWGASQQVPEEEENPPSAGDDDGDFINPMASLSLGARGSAPSDYAPPANTTKKINLNEEEEDDDDLGFGNTSLSRGRTPKPPPAASGSNHQTPDSTPAEDEKKSDAAPEPPKPQQKGSWLGKWWGKKEGEGSGPIRAKLGEESSMVYDTELKRWVVKGAKGEASAPATPPPPPRAQTASPSRAVREDPAARAMSATPPPSQLQQQRHNGPTAPPPPGMPRSSTTPMGMGMGFTEMPDGGIKRMKSSLNESITADTATATTAPSNGPPGPPGPGGPPAAGPSRPPSRPATGASIDDLLSRPPSKRPASAAKKGMRNRYVDVLQPGAEGQ